MANMDKDIFHSGRTWILFGFLVLLSSELFVFRNDYKLIVSSLLSQIGIALIIMGIIAIILQFKDMKSYFQDRLKEIVIQRSYLESLSDEELTTIQIDTLKAKYKNTDIDKEGSFLHYFQSKIQGYLEYPYRESVNSSLLIEIDEERPDCFKVYDNTTYLCRANGDKIQEEVKWMYEKDEFSDIYDVKLVLRCPIVLEHECNNNCYKDNECVSGVITINKDELDAKFLLKDKPQEGYWVPFKNILWVKDLLHVELRTIYAIKRESLFSWAMTHPSKGITLTITYPNGYKLIPFVGGIEPREYTNSFNGNMYVFKHDGWFLPRTGIAWNLIKQIV